MKQPSMTVSFDLTADNAQAVALIHGIPIKASQYCAWGEAFMGRDLPETAIFLHPLRVWVQKMKAATR